MQLLRTFSPLSAVLCMALGMMPVRATTTERETLIALERAWSAAVLRQDAAAVAALLSDDYIGIDGRGIVSHKADELAEAASPPVEQAAPRLRIVKETLSDFDVRIYGDIAIVNALNTAEVSFDGKPDTFKYRRTTVWHRKGSGWQCVAFHASRVQAPAP